MLSALARCSAFDDDLDPAGGAGHLADDADGTDEADVGRLGVLDVRRLQGEEDHPIARDARGSPRPSTPDGSRRAASRSSGNATVSRRGSTGSDEGMSVVGRSAMEMCYLTQCRKAPSNGQS